MITNDAIKQVFLRNTIFIEMKKKNLFYPVYKERAGETVQVVNKLRSRVNSI